VRLVTDIDGQLIGVVGITNQSKEINIDFRGEEYSLQINPNAVYSLNGKGEFVKKKTIPFTYK